MLLWRGEVAFAFRILAAILLGAVGTSATNSSSQEDEFSSSKELERLGASHSIDLQNRVFFELYTRQNSQTPEIIDISSMSQTNTRPKFFDPQKPVRVCVHGWRSSTKKMMTVGRGFLAEGDYNIIMMNWGKADNIIYQVARKRVEQLGKLLAQFINLLIDIYNLDATDFHLVGFSLGAHISGVAGRNIQQGRIGRITGLDPAGPLFKGAPDALFHDAAFFVDVIHTCGRVFGYWDPMGHVDFYPNGGKSQPGCKPWSACSHSRSRDIFAESLISQIGFWSWPFTEGGPQSVFPTNRNQTLAGYTVDTSARGVYYFVTSGRPPYAVCPPFDTAQCTKEVNKTRWLEFPMKVYTLLKCVSVTIISALLRLLLRLYSRLLHANYMPFTRPLQLLNSYSLLGNIGAFLTKRFGHIDSKWCFG